MIESGFNIDQANFDSNMLLSIILFIIYMTQDKSKYVPYDYFMANLNIVIIILGIFAFTRALASGNAGPVQAIQETKTIVQTILTIIILQKYPNLMQYFGLFSGLAGVTVIVSQKKKAAENKK